MRCSDLGTGVVMVFLFINEAGSKRGGEHQMDMLLNNGTDLCLWVIFSGARVDCQ